MFECSERSEYPNRVTITRQQPESHHLANYLSEGGVVWLPEPCRKTHLTGCL